jgi:D-amino peptidase
MKIFVMVDMEGISGIVKREQVSRSESLYAKGCEYIVGDVNACVEGLVQGGADEIVVRDAHSSGFNFIWDRLDPRAEYIQGGGKRPRMPGIEEMDGMVLLGYHAMAGTEDAVLEHTMSSAAWQNFWINGVKSGEIAIDAGIAGDAGVPTIMVSGCDKACREAEDFIDGIYAAVVKTAYGVEYAKLLPQEKAHALITETACKAAENCKNIKPYKVESPVTMRLERVERGQPPDFGDKPYFKKIDSRTYEVTGDSVLQALERL